MKTIKISQIQFEAKSTPFKNAELLKKYFEKTKKFKPDLICTPECSNIITNDINYLRKNTTFETADKYLSNSYSPNMFFIKKIFLILK